MRVYFDYNATTPLAPGVADAVTTATRDLFGNASSVHYFGQQAKAALDEARASIAALVGAEASEVVFTSGGTESDNFAIRGAAATLEQTGRRHLVASAFEHEAVLNTLKALARRGWRTTLLPVDQTGIVSPERVRELITDDTAIVSVMHRNNEIGTVQPIAELAAIAHARGALMHTDAVQSTGKIPVDVRGLGVDLLSLSAHKFNGPKGTGALWIKRGTRMQPLLTGGKHERNRRAGTENVPAIIGMGAAARLAAAKMIEEGRRVESLRNRLEDAILRTIPGTAVNGARQPRVPNTTHKGRTADHAHRRSNVRRRRLFRRRGAARRAGPRRHRCIDAALRRVGRGRPRLVRQLLLARRPARRAARGGRDQHSPLHRQL